ncbi:PhzF family phenazine biosynthesis protein [Pseudanabaena sp. PCC 6802]|uniref:PhzF family phenazine biosynthesis protein n=1 Tax=Pseudanabaena sp. PCC 6802 TaxID=118173 RepID=UPI0003493D91|nr:PhzF family phenazine biosynthesis protein [Pseudanabaena sp. PCC 6802]
MEYQIFTIDAFTQTAFSGNPAATVLVDKFPDDALMQKIAAEMNLSETVFAQPISPNAFHLRWFTPAAEVPLCGHATLAMSHYLKELRAIDLSSPLVFQTLSGDLVINLEGDRIVMDFPAVYPTPCDRQDLSLLESIMGNQPYECLGVADNVTVVLANESAVANFVPDFAAIAQLSVGRLTITAIADPEHPYDFVSRFFAPKVGINEDPVTGSAHCTLAPYWAKRLNKNPLQAKQLSQRTGDLEVEHIGDRVKLKGFAVTVLRGSLSI